MLFTCAVNSLTESFYVLWMLEIYILDVKFSYTYCIALCINYYSSNRFLLLLVLYWAEWNGSAWCILCCKRFLNVHWQGGWSYICVSYHAIFLLMKIISESNQENFQMNLCVCYINTRNKHHCQTLMFLEKYLIRWYKNIQYFTIHTWVWLMKKFNLK